MKYTVRGYSLRHNVSLYELFYKSWLHVYKSAPPRYEIQEWAERYAACGAIPFYVTCFLEAESVKGIERPRLKHHLPWYARIA